VDRLLEALAQRPASTGVANPYAGPGASARLRNLRAYLGAVAGGFETGGPRVLLVGEAPGYRGCAVTGVPFTSRQVLASGVEVGRWGLFPAGEFEAGEALGRPWAEATATLVWRHLPGALASLPGPPLLWNAFPFHPYALVEGGEGGTNRGLARAEREEGVRYLRLVLDLFPGGRAVAVGRVAAGALARVGVRPLAVLRHPAHGGATRFAEGLHQAGAALRPDTISTGPPATR
jgi:hypothetical protein